MRLHFWQTTVATQGIIGVRLLGHKDELTWTREDNALIVELPEKPPCDYAIGFEILVKGELK